MKTRVLSAILIIAVFIPFFILGGVPFLVFMSILGLFGFYELLKVHKFS